MLFCEHVILIPFYFTFNSDTFWTCYSVNYWVITEVMGWVFGSDVRKIKDVLSLSFSGSFE